MEQQEMVVTKVTLSTGKSVLLRKMKIKDKNIALQAVGLKANGNQALLGALLGDEMLKLLVVQVDGQPVDRKKIEDLDSYFEVEEYGQLMSVIQQLSGGEDGLGKPTTEIVRI